MAPRTPVLRALVAPRTPVLRAFVAPSEYSLVYLYVIFFSFAVTFTILAVFCMFDRVTIVLPSFSLDFWLKVPYPCITRLTNMSVRGPSFSLFWSASFHLC